MSSLFSSLKNLAIGGNNDTNNTPPTLRCYQETEEISFSISPPPPPPPPSTSTSDHNLKKMGIPDTQADFNQWLHAMKMVARLPGGMPPEFRRKLWLALSDRYLQTKGINWDEEGEKYLSEQWDEDDEELGIQIVKDLHRTGSSLCSGPSGTINQGKLKRVLLGYSRFNPEVGYCQGFNMLGALILQVMDKNEADSIKVMILLIEGLLPAGYFCGSLGGLQTDMAVFRDLLGTKLPKLARHLQKLQGPEGAFEPPLTNVFTMQWFLTLFCTCLPIPSVLRIWDLILIEGSDVLLRTALAIWGLLEGRIIATKTADDFYCKMGALSTELVNGNLTDCNGLIQRIVDIGPIVDIQKLRDKHLHNITHLKESSNLRIFYSDDEGESDEDSRLAVTATAWGFRSGRRASLNIPTNLRSASEGKEKINLDISLLKKQYDKLRERQRQAHIILTAAVARQPTTNQQGSSSLQVNQLLVGKSAILSNKGKRLGPPQGAVPPVRAQKTSKQSKSGAPKSPKPTETLHWRDMDDKQRRGSLKWKDMQKDVKKPTVKDDTDVSKPESPKLVKSSSASSAISNLSETASSSVGAKRRSESSSYSEESDADSSTSTSLCDDENQLLSASSLEASPMKRRLTPDSIKEVPDEERLVVTSDDAPCFEYPAIVEIQRSESTLPDIAEESHSETQSSSTELKHMNSKLDSQNIVFTADSLKSKHSELIHSPADDKSLSIAITSTSQLSPIPDISHYVSMSTISPLKTPSSIMDYSDYLNNIPSENTITGDAPITDVKDNLLFNVNEEGVTNQLFERINAAERPNQLDLNVIKERKVSESLVNTSESVLDHSDNTSKLDNYSFTNVSNRSSMSSSFVLELPMRTSLQHDSPLLPPNTDLSIIPSEKSPIIHKTPQQKLSSTNTNTDLSIMQLDKTSGIQKTSPNKYQSVDVSTEPEIIPSEKSPIIHKTPLQKFPSTDLSMIQLNKIPGIQKTSPQKYQSVDVCTELSIIPSEKSPVIHKTSLQKFPSTDVSTDHSITQWDESSSIQRTTTQKYQTVDVYAELIPSPTSPTIHETPQQKYRSADASIDLSKIPLENSSVIQKALHESIDAFIDIPKNPSKQCSTFHKSAQQKYLSPDAFTDPAIISLENCTIVQNQNVQEHQNADSSIDISILRLDKSPEFHKTPHQEYQTLDVSTELSIIPSEKSPILHTTPQQSYQSADSTTDLLILAPQKSPTIHTTSQQKYQIADTLTPSPKESPDEVEQFLASRIKFLKEKSFSMDDPIKCDDLQPEDISKRSASEGLVSADINAYKSNKMSEIIMENSLILGRIIRKTNRADDSHAEETVKQEEGKSSCRSIESGVNLKITQEVNELLEKIKADSEPDPSLRASVEEIQVISKIPDDVEFTPKHPKLSPSKQIPISMKSKDVSVCGPSKQESDLPDSTKAVSVSSSSENIDADDRPTQTISKTDLVIKRTEEQLARFKEPEPTYYIRKDNFREIITPEEEKDLSAHAPEETPKPACEDKGTKSFVNVETDPLLEPTTTLKSQMNDTVKPLNIVTGTVEQDDPIEPNTPEDLGNTKSPEEFRKPLTFTAIDVRSTTSSKTDELIKKTEEQLARFQAHDRKVLEKLEKRLSLIDFKLDETLVVGEVLEVPERRSSSKTEEVIKKSEEQISRIKIESSFMTKKSPTRLIAEDSVVCEVKQMACSSKTEEIIKKTDEQLARFKAAAESNAEKRKSRHEIDELLQLKAESPDLSSRSSDSMKFDDISIRDAEEAVIIKQAQAEIFKSIKMPEEVRSSKTGEIIRKIEDGKIKLGNDYITTIKTIDYLKQSNANLSATLSSIEISIKAIDGLCDHDSDIQSNRINDTIDNLEKSLKQFDTVSSEPPLVMVHDYSSSPHESRCRPSASNRPSRSRKRKEYSPRRKKEKDRDDRIILNLRKDHSSEYSSDNQSTDWETNKTHTFHSYYSNSPPTTPRVASPVKTLPEPTEIMRPSSFKSTSHDRYLLQRDTQFIKFDKSPSSPIINKSYLESLMPATPVASGRTTRSAENSPPFHPYQPVVFPPIASQFIGLHGGLLRHQSGHEGDNSHIKSCENILMRFDYKNMSAIAASYPVSSVLSPSPTQFRSLDFKHDAALNFSQTSSPNKTLN